MMEFFRRLAERLGRLGSDPAEEADRENPGAHDDGERAELSLSYKGLSLKAAYRTPSDSEIEAGLQPISRARASGAQNNPPAAQRDLSSDEDEIVLFFKNFLRQTEQKVFDILATLRNDLEREQAAAMAPNVDRSFAKLDGELRTLKLEWAGRLIEANQDRLEAWRILRHFRATQRISRPASYPDSFYFDFMILSGLVMLETAGNAIFYQTGNEYGYVGGLANAFLVSLVNVFIAFFALGYLSLRHLHVKAAPVKLIAMIGMVLSVGAIGLLNLAAAHYRDMLSAVPQAQLVDAVGEVFRRGFSLDTLPALALLLFGYTLAAFAAYKGYFFDDPIPGFGSVTREYEQAKARQRNLEIEFRSALDASARRHASAVEREIEGFRRGLNARQTAIALYAQIRTYFPDYQRNVIQRLCNATLRRYREENARVRTSGVPIAFGQYPIVYLDVTLPDLPAGLRDLDREIAELSNADKLFARLHSEFLDRVEIFYSGIEKEIEVIEQMAASRLDRREPVDETFR